MKKLLCGAVISSIGVIYSITLIIMATVNQAYVVDGIGLWGLLQGYDAVMALIISLIVVAIGIVLCIWGTFEKEK